MADVNTKSTGPGEEWEAREDTYSQWQTAQKIPRVTGLDVYDINELELAPWEQKGGLGTFINLKGTGDVTDAYICEIPPGGKLKPQRHLYEEVVYIVKGHGATTVWQKSGKKHTFEWQPGSFFVIPLNAAYQHFNGSGSETVRYLSITTAPFIMNIFHNLDFIFENEFAFTDRFDPEDETYFSRGEKRLGRSAISVNFVRDVYSISHIYNEVRRGGMPGTRGYGYMDLAMGGQVLGPHLNTYPVGVYPPAHYHPPGAHLLILEGQGYDLLWPFEHYSERVRIDLKPGSLFVPPDRWFHQHFNTGPVMLRQLAIKPWGVGRKSTITMGAKPGSYVKSTKWGGTQLEYEDEDPEIHKEWEAALAETGVTCVMGEYHPFCSQRSNR